MARTRGRKNKARTVIGKPEPVVRTQVRVLQYRGTKYEGTASRNITIYATAEAVTAAIEPVLRQAFGGDGVTNSEGGKANYEP